MNKRLTIAIQKKGRLNQDSVDLITKSGISFSTNGERLLAKSSNFDIDILLVRDDDIPSLVEKKVADLGIVGENVLLEYKSVRKSSKTVNVLDLGFSKCKLAFAKPEGKKIKSAQPFYLVLLACPALVRSPNVGMVMSKVNISVLPDL